MLAVAHERMASGRVRFDASCSVGSESVLHKKVASLAGSLSKGTAKKATRTFRKGETTGNTYTYWAIYEFN